MEVTLEQVGIGLELGWHLKDELKLATGGNTGSPEETQDLRQMHSLMEESTEAPWMWYVVYRHSMKQERWRGPGHSGP